VQVVQALAAGNAVVLKPGPAGSGAARQLTQLLHTAGLPAGLLRVLPVSADAAQSALTSGVDKVVFTGSAKTGKAVLAQLAPLAVPAVMELSGSDAIIIRAMPTDLAVRAVASVATNAGQTRIAAARAGCPLATESRTPRAGMRAARPRSCPVGHARAPGHAALARAPTCSPAKSARTLRCSGRC
jgi:acyl-CoA reductase-like NAD-dependent aldehyde dehydrogenase